MTLPETIRKGHHTWYLCKHGCGKYTSHKSGQCLDCSIKIRYSKRYVSTPRHKCNNGCGKPVWKINQPCRKCYNLLRQTRTTGVKVQPSNSRLKYPCKKCGKLKDKPGICRDCYNKALRIHTKNQIVDRKRQEQNIKRLREKDGTNGLIICPKNSSGGSHIEIIADIEVNKETHEIRKIGTCKFCGKQKDYTTLQQDISW
jgi:hypothetical protein